MIIVIWEYKVIIIIVIWEYRVVTIIVIWEYRVVIIIVIWEYIVVIMVIQVLLSPLRIAPLIVIELKILNSKI